MPQPLRGKPLPINSALNASRTKLGLELPIWIAIVFICFLVYLAGFHTAPVLVFPLCVAGAWLTVRKQPKMAKLWQLGLRQEALYDPRKR